MIPDGLRLEQIGAQRNGGDDYRTGGMRNPKRCLSLDHTAWRPLLT